MWVKLLRDGMGLKAGDVIELPDVLAERAIAKGIAALATEPDQQPRTMDDLNRK
jgi:hypothetical protein